MWCRLTKTQTKIGNENGSWGAWVRDSVSVSCAWRGGIHIIPTLYITQSFFFRESDRMGRGVCSTSNTVRGSLLQQGPNASATTIGKSIVMADSW